MKAIVDTGFIVAFANRRDRYHGWAVELAKQVTDPFLTCEAVLAEAAFHLENSAYVLSLVKTGLIRSALDITDQLPALTQIANRYADRKPDLADICLIRMSELFYKYPVITVDVNDFKVYRRNRNEVIPL